MDGRWNRIIALMVVALFTVPPAAQAAPQGADLSLQMEASPAQVRKGEVVTFSVLVLNKGPARATDVTVTDQVPGAFSVTGATASQGTCSGGQTVTCSLGSLAKQAAASIEVTARAVQQGNHSNEATVSSSSTDSRPENNGGSVTVSVTGPPAPPLPVRCSGNAPVDGVGCGASFSVSTTTPVTLAFTDRPLTGVLRAVITGASGVAGEIWAEFVGGVPTSGTTSQSLSLPAGEYQLWVAIMPARTRHLTIQKPGLPWAPPSTLPGCLFQLQPLGATVWCVYGALPSVVRDSWTITVPGVPMPMAVGGFGAEVVTS